MEIRPNLSRPLPGKQSLDSDAQRARKEAIEERAKAQQEIRETQQVLDENLRDLHRQYERQNSDESTRMEAAIEQQRNRGYEAVRETQRKQQAEMARIKREGEKQIRDLEEYYLKAQADIQVRGDKEINQIRAKSGNQVTLEADAANFALEETKANDSAKIQRYKEQSEMKLQQEHEAFKLEHERLRENTAVAKQHDEEIFGRQFEEVHSRHRDILDRIQTESDEQIRDLRQNQTRRIDAYQSRARDPFYQPVGFDARLREAGDEFVLMADIPEQERPNVSVVISGNQMVLQVQRRNEEKLEVDPGHRVATNSFQTFRETFPLSAPVDARQLTTRFDGDRLIATVPKAGVNVRYNAKGQQATPVRLERPRLPNNLVVSAPPPETTDPEAPKPKSRGVRPMGA